jgi:lantibiotic modifying enzyme
MFAAGALTAVAYCLRMVDLHLENLVVHTGRPIIVDPECILYAFSAREGQDRLLSTGLLSHNPGLSSLRGGDPSRQAIVRIGLCERSDGTLDYQEPAASFRNRFRGPTGELADPSDHRQSLFGGFTAAFEWFLRNTDLVLDILNHWVVDDFRIRYLIRKTRLYIATIHMLNLPISCRYERWRDGIFARFCQAGHFPKEITEGVVTAELTDMDARHVPFFWVNAGEAVIRHRTGAKQRLPHHWHALTQAVLDIRSLSRGDMNHQIGVLADFLDADLHVQRTTYGLADHPAGQALGVG